MILNIGFIGYWNSGDIDEYKQNMFFDVFDEYNISYKECDPTQEECDIVFCCVFEDLRLYKKIIKGKPVFISNRTEPRGYFYDNDRYCKYFIGFNRDSENSLYYPLWLFYMKDYEYRSEGYINLDNKSKFCSFIFTNSKCDKRNELFKYISNQYKQVDSLGVYENNTGFILERGNFEYPKQYKFNICFENSASGNDYVYITEKIIRAYAYDSIPIYWGNNNISKFFNAESFINCNGLSNQEILDKIKELDNDDEKYLKILNAYSFNSNNYKNISSMRLIQFLDNILIKEINKSIYEFAI